MANVLYDLAKQSLLTAGLNWTTADLRVMLVDTANYTINAVTDEFLNDITDNAGAEVARTTAAMTNPTALLGVADADDISFLSVAGGTTAEAVVIYEQVTNDTDSPLIAYIDTATGLPVTTDGNNVNVLWDSGADRIFAI
ncbi:MAG: hypothetical protein K0U78_15355 [Actinomycetia bacterium]|nr:hypothetical protein [Actinomycetes bacterium]